MGLYAGGHPCSFPDELLRRDTARIAQTYENASFYRPSSVARKVRVWCQSARPRGGTVSTLLQDLRFAVRQLSKSPGFTLVALCTLALGIGANTAIYSIIHGALRLPYDNASRIVAVENVYPQGSYFANSWPDFQQWRSQQKTFTHFASTFTVRSTWTGAGEPQLLNVGLVTDGYFGVYGVSPILGRALAPADHQKGAGPVCLLVADF